MATEDADQLITSDPVEQYEGDDQIAEEPNLKEEIDCDDTEQRTGETTEAESQAKYTRDKYRHYYKYKHEWEREFPWVEKATAHTQHAYCTLCGKTLIPRHHTLVKHEKTKIHAESVDREKIRAQLQRCKEENPDESGPVGEVLEADDDDEDTKVIVIHQNDTMHLVPMEVEVESQPVNCQQKGSQNLIAQPKTDFENFLMNASTETLISLVGPTLFDKLTMWELLLNKATLQPDLNGTDVVLKDLESMLFEAKSLMINCFEKSDQSKRKRTIGVDLTPILAQGLELDSGFWEQKDPEQIQCKRPLEEKVLRQVIPDNETVAQVKQEIVTGKPRGRSSRRNLQVIKIINDNTSKGQPVSEKEKEKENKPETPLRARRKRKRKRNYSSEDDSEEEKELPTKKKDIKFEEPKPVPDRDFVKNCKRCGNTFPFTESTRKHEEYCPGVMRYRRDGKHFLCQYPACPQAGHVYEKKLDLLEHIDNIHVNEDERTVPCTYEGCTVMSKSVIMRNIHIRKNHDKSFECNDCKKTFWFKKHLTDHIEKVHKNPQQEDASRAICLKCGKTRNKASMRNHEKTCQGSTVRNPTFKVVNDEFFCTAKDCLVNHGFASMHGLRVHFFDAHLDDTEKRFECEHCGKKFADGIMYRRHVKSVHIKPVVCSLCAGRFVNKSQLSEHMNTHTGNKPFTCDKCDFRCAKKFNLVDHKRKKHNDLSGRNFYCGLCGKVFLTSGRLTSHLRIIHQDGLVENLVKERSKPPANAGSSKRTRNVAKVEFFDKKDKELSGQVEQDMAVDFLINQEEVEDSVQFI